MSITEHVSMTHTPGPWRCDRKHEECEVYYIDANATKPNWPWPVEIAVVYSDHAADGAQVANARLIAAAPTMYHELELAADTFRDMANVLRVIGKDTMSAAAAIAERHIREQLATIHGTVMKSSEAVER